MHVAHQLRPENLQISIHKQEADLEALFPEGHKYDRYRAAPDSMGRAGPSVAADIDRWVESVLVRKDEVDREAIRLHAAQRLRRQGDRLVRTESFRWLSADNMFALLAGF